MDKQQDPTVQQRELYSIILVIKHSEKEYKKNTYICVSVYIYKCVCVFNGTTSLYRRN